MPFLPWVATIGNITPPLGVAQGGTGATAAPAGAVALGAMGLQANVALAGFALINGTQDVVTWTAPNDGALHRFLVIGTIDVTSAETGGQIIVSWTLPDNTASGSGIQLFAGGRATGAGQSSVNGQVRAGTTVAVHQQTALTVGAATLWADIYGA